jgi:hypothetical protein
MKPFRGVFSARPYGGETNGNHHGLAGPDAPLAEVAPGLFSPRLGPKHLLWEVLVELGFVDERRVLEAEAVARASRQDLGAVLLERGLVSSDQLARAVAQREGVLFADLDAYPVEEEAASLITPAVAERYGAMPIGYGPDGDVLLALANPRDRHAVNDISMMIEPSVTRVVATQDKIDALIKVRKEAAYETEAGEGDVADPEDTSASQHDPSAASASEEGNVVELRTPGLDEPFEPSVEQAAADETAGWFASEPPQPESASAEGSAELSEAAQPADEAQASTAIEAPDSENVDEPTGDDEQSAHEAPDVVAAQTRAVASEALEPSPAGASEMLEPSVPDAPEPIVGREPSPEPAPAAAVPVSPDRELLESLSNSVAEVERLVRETVREHDDDHEAAAAESDRRLASAQAEMERERAERAEAERALREQLEGERAARGESERRLREEAEAERASREATEGRLRAELETERSERAEAERLLREELETERSERGGTERSLREELEGERSTREALATELAAVRTARDDLARRVAGARDLLEQGARPFVPLNGRDR